MTAWPKQAKDILESELQSAVVATAGHLGWRVYHTYDSRRSEYGFPDLCLVRGEYVMFVELKREGKHPTQSQAAWLYALEQTPALVYVWRPAQWIDGTIEAILRDPMVGAG